MSARPFRLDGHLLRYLDKESFGKDPGPAWEVLDIRKTGNLQIHIPYDAGMQLRPFNLL